MPQSDHSRFWIAAEVFLAAALVVLPASLGGAPEWTSWVLWLLSVGALTAWVLGAQRNHRRWGWHASLTVPSLLVGVTLLQLVPLPPTLLEVLSPRQAALRDFSLVPLGLTSWRPLAVDVPATLKALSRLLSLGGLFFVALKLGRVEGVRRRLFSVLALSASVTAVCGFLHLLAGADALFGVRPFYGVVPLITPFGNTNHLAAWLTLGSTVALGLAFTASSRDAAIGWGAAAAVSATAIFFSFSRGGIGVFIGTWGLVGVSLLARRSGGMRGSLPWAFIVGTVLVAGFLSFEQLLERAETLSTLDKFKATKIDLWPMFSAGLAHYWLTGMGAGGFELGFAPWQTRELTTTFTHPEMLALQWVADFGLPVTLITFGVIAWLAWRLWFITRADTTANIALLALVGVAVHDVFDFALELNAVAPAACIVTGLLFAMDSSSSRLRVRRMSLPAGAVVLLTGGLALVFALPGFRDAEEALRDDIVGGRSFAEVRAHALKLIDRHPLDWVLYANVARDASRRASPHESLAWINRVLTLRPRDVSSHLSAAQALSRLGSPSQALAEYKLAWAGGDDSSLPAGLLLAARLGAWERVLIDAPGHLTRAYSTLRAQRKDEDARALLEAARLLPPNDEVGLEAELLLVRHESELGSPLKALEAVDALEGALRERPEFVMTRVQALSRLGRNDEAAAALERLLNRDPTNLAAGFMLVDLLASQGKPAAARDVLQRLRPFANAAGQRSVMFQREATLWIQEERYPRALDALQTAVHIEPQNAGLHYRLAEVYERMGSLHSAVDEIRRGRLLDTPEGAKSRDAWLNRLEAALGPLQ